MTLNAPFRDKPWYLAIFTAGRWVTVYPYINLPSDTNPSDFPWIVAHESVHLKQQQAMGVGKWMWRYFTDRAFRLDQEAAGAVAEYKEQVAENRNADHVLLNYADDFASSAYFWAASSPEAAMTVIKSHL